MRSARSNRRWSSPIRSRQSSNARSNRNNSAPIPRRAIPAHGAQLHVEQVGPSSVTFAALVRCPPASDKSGMVGDRCFARLSRWALDFALPPRCAGCGIIVGEVHSFCSDCWRQIEFLGEIGCSTCGMPLQGTEATSCGACLAKPPRIARTRAAVAYDELSRGLAIRLKYGRKVAIARTMARYMAPLVARGDNACWSRFRCIAPACGGGDSINRRSSRARFRAGSALPPIPF